MPGIDLVSLGNLALAIITLIGGLISGWIARQKLQPNTPSSPLYTPTIKLPPLQGVPEVVPDSATPERNRVFQRLVKLLLQLPLVPREKATAIQDLDKQLADLFPQAQANPDIQAQIANLMAALHLQAGPPASSGAAVAPPSSGAPASGS